ncbi:accessory gene regulator B family protein [Clostridium sp. P21]|uniref:Accessory gene regulator B family protein n=1 Tax=Clostridium muellerianum TaxID=2716538 RepID=A0A7Y0EDV8_9CLOT|nr:accessory gene regulator B family protein [Clostridium muellerianum]NMM61317.1 accessory gene regulator B family protein [Clostridium muellerianum]
MFLTESLSNKIGYKIARTLKLDKDSEEIMAYGAFCLLQIFWSILWIMLFGIVFNMLIEVFIIFFVICILRKYSGGVHASSPGRCTIVGITVCVGFSLIIHKIYWMFNLYYIVFFSVISLIFSYYIVYKLAPVDSIAKPIVKMETKKRFKRKSILILNILSIIIFVILIFYFKYSNVFLLNSIMCICVGAVWQSFTLTNEGHKILTKIDNILKNFARK